VERQDALKAIVDRQDRSQGWAWPRHQGRSCCGVRERPGEAALGLEGGGRLEWPRGNGRERRRGKRGCGVRGGKIGRQSL
jgi:hypothetical protein